jgi:hypothetical protein
LEPLCLEEANTGCAAPIFEGPALLDHRSQGSVGHAVSKQIGRMFDGVDFAELHWHTIGEAFGNRSAIAQRTATGCENNCSTGILRVAVSLFSAEKDLVLAFTDFKGHLPYLSFALT